MPPEQATLTIAEAVAWLDPPMTARQLARILIELKVVPVGQRKPHRGRPAHAYDATEIMDLHHALGPWLAEGGYRRDPHETEVDGPAASYGPDS